MSKSFISELPCEDIVRKVCGPQWRSLDERSKDAAWGIAIVRAILDGVPPDLRDLASYLGVDKDILFMAYRNLSLNGAFLCGRIQSDAKLLRSGDQLAWGYYGGYACGATGPVII